MISIPGQGGETERDARRIMGTRAIFGIAEAARKAINATAAGAFEALRYHLARAYVEGYRAGWTQRAEFPGEVMRPPEPR